MAHGKLAIERLARAPFIKELLDIDLVAARDDRYQLVDDRAGDIGSFRVGLADAHADGPKGDKFSSVWVFDIRHQESIWNINMTKKMQL